MESPTQKPHVLVLTSPGSGHLVPTLGLAKRLASFSVLKITLFVVSADHASFSQSLLLKSSSEFHQDLSIVDLTPPNVAELVSADLSIESRIGIIMKESFTILESKIACMESPPAALIAEFFCMGAFHIADRLRLPKYLFITGTAWFAALILYAPTLDQEVEGEFADLNEPITIPGCKPLQPGDLIDPMLDRESERYIGCLKLAEQLQMADGIIMNTWEELEPLTVKAFRENNVLRLLTKPNVYPVGPIVRGVGSEGTANECWHWLNMQPNESVLYVSFGSGGNLTSEQMNELAWGLEQSRQRFIWVVRPPSDIDASGSFFGSNGCQEDLGYLPNNFLKRVHGVGLVVQNWAPQEYILAHPSIGGFLSHCGWNSTLESIMNGVPIIAWPLFAEQHMNAALLAEDLGVAVRAESLRSKGVIKREDIARIVKLVMVTKEGKEMRDKVNDAKQGALKAMAEGGSSYSSLLELVNEIRINRDAPLLVKA